MNEWDSWTSIGGNGVGLCTGASCVKEVFFEQRWGGTEWTSSSFQLTTRDV